MLFGHAIGIGSETAYFLSILFFNFSVDAADFTSNDVQY